MSVSITFKGAGDTKYVYFLVSDRARVVEKPGRLDVHDKIVKALREIGISQDEVLKASGMWNKGINLTYCRAVEKALTAPMSPDVRDAFGKLGDFEKWQAPTPDEVERFLNAHALANPEAASWIDDYRHFERTHEIRRRELFAQQ